MIIFEGGTVSNMGNNCANSSSVLVPGPSQATESLWLAIQPAIRYARGMLALMVVWHLLSLKVDNAVLLPSPLMVASDWWSLLLSGKLLGHFLSSVWRAVVAFLLAGAVAIPLGLLMGLSRIAEDVCDPIVELVRPISGIAWIPLALYIFGIGNALPIFIIFYVAFFPFVLNTIAGVRSVDPILVRAAKVMGLRRFEIIRQVILPSTLPSVLTGARLGASGAWMALIAAEFVGAPSGLGFAIQWYGGLLRTSDMLAMIATIALLGYGTDVALRGLHRRLTPWAAGLGVAQ